MRDADEGVRGEAVKAIFHMTLDNPSRTEKAVLDEVALRMRDKKVPLFFFYSYVYSIRLPFEAYLSIVCFE